MRCTYNMLKPWTVHSGGHRLVPSGHTGDNCSARVSVTSAELWSRSTTTSYSFVALEGYISTLALSLPSCTTIDSAESAAQPLLAEEGGGRLSRSPPISSSWPNAPQHQPSGA